MKLNLIVLKTSRPDELAFFYEQLGLKFEHHKHGSGPLHYSSHIDGVVFEIYPLPQDKNNADDTLRIGFTVNGLDDTIKRLKNIGGTITKEPTMTEWGYVSIIKDPDGRKIELTDKNI